MRSFRVRIASACLTETDPAACISALPAPGAKSQLGTNDVFMDIQAAFEDAKAKTEAAGADWQACASDVATCATDTEAKAKAKLEADAAMAKAKAEMMKAAVTNGVTAGMAEFSECTGSSDAIAACANAKVEQAQADAEAAKSDVEACMRTVKRASRKPRLTRRTRWVCSAATTNRRTAI